MVQDHNGGVFHGGLAQGGLAQEGLAQGVGLQGGGAQGRGMQGGLALGSLSQGGLAQEGWVHGEVVQEGWTQDGWEQGGGTNGGGTQGGVVQGDFAQEDWAQGDAVQEGWAQGGGVQGQWKQGEEVQRGWGHGGEVHDGAISHQDEVQGAELHGRGGDVHGGVHGGGVGGHRRIARFELEAPNQARVFDSGVAREKAKVENIVEQLTKKSSTNIDHRKSVLDTATELNNLKYHDDSETGAKVNHDDIKLAIQESTSSDSVLEHLWNCPGVRDYFSKRENCSNLEDLMSLSSSSSPLNTFPTDIDSNIYCDIISYGLKHSKGMIMLLLNLLVKRECPVQEKDVVRVAYIYSLLGKNFNKDPRLRSILL